MENKKIDSSNGRILMGALLLIVGGGLLVHKLVTPLPEWLISWETILITIGLIIGVNKGFKGVAWLVLVLIGGIFLIGDIYPALPFRNLLWPAILIGFGLLLILSPKTFRTRNWDGWKKDSFNQEGYASDDYLDSVSIFGSVRKVLLSKDFKGGEVTSFMGGSELDLSQADITGRVVLEITQVMGGTKLIVPSHWDIKSELVSIFGGIEDKRKIQSPDISSEKVLVLIGTSVFGGIEIRNF